MTGFGSMLRALWRFHRLLAGIVVLEYALAFAIMLIASGILFARADAINESSGIADAGLYVLQGQGQSRVLHGFDVRDARERFATVAGATNVAEGSSVPFLGRSSIRVQVDLPDDLRGVDSLQANAYEGEAQFASVLGLHLVHGRWFRPEEIARHYGESTHLVVLSLPLAQRLFHGETAVGRQVRITGELHTVIGVVGPLAAPQYLGSRDTTLTLLLPRLVGNGVLLVIRHDGAATDLQPALSALRKHTAGEVEWALNPYSSVRAGYFRQDRLVVMTLALVVLAVLLTALCGILGLTGYWIAKRRTQIAIRRALGATRHDIDRHFLAESGVLVMAGLLLGVTFALLGGLAQAGLRVHTGLAVWAFAIGAVLLLAVLVVHVSLRRWSRMNPVELMRQR